MYLKKMILNGEKEDNSLLKTESRVAMLLKYICLWHLVPTQKSELLLQLGRCNENRNN